MRDEDDVDEEDPVLDFGDEASFDPSEVTEVGNDEGRRLKICL